MVTLPVKVRWSKYIIGFHCNYTEEKYCSDFLDCTVVYLALRTYSFSFEIPVKLLSDSLNCVVFLESISAYI